MSEFVTRESIVEFARICARTLPLIDPVYEFGSFQVEGQVGFADMRPLFSAKQYVGADMRTGPWVDVVLNLHHLDLPSESVAASAVKELDRRTTVTPGAGSPPNIALKTARASSWESRVSHSYLEIFSGERSRVLSMTEPWTLGPSLILTRAALTSEQKIPSRPREMLRSKTATRLAPARARFRAARGKGRKRRSLHSPTLRPAALILVSAFVGTRS